MSLVQISLPVKHRQSHLVDPAIAGSRARWGAAMAITASGMPSLECRRGQAGRTRRRGQLTAQRHPNGEGLRLMSLQCSLQRRALATDLGALSYYNNILCNWKCCCPRQLGTLASLIRPTAGASNQQPLRSVYVLHSKSWVGSRLRPRADSVLLQSQPARGWTQACDANSCSSGRA